MEGTFVGWWILEPPARPDQGPVEGQAELGHRLLRRCWRQGLAGKGARALLRHGFEDLGLARVFAETVAVNTGSQATTAAAGMQYARTFHLEHDDALPGSEFGEVEHAVSREQWSARWTIRCGRGVAARRTPPSPRAPATRRSRCGRPARL